MKNDTVKELVWSSLGIALVFLATFLLKIPNGIQGYVHMGDGFIMLFSSVLSPLCAVLVAAAGSALADIAGGYAYFALFTLIIKGLEAFLIAKIFQKSKLRFVSYFTGSLVMIFGYFLTDAFINQSWYLALTGIPGNIIQAAVGILIAFLIYPLFISNFKK